MQASDFRVTPVEDRFKTRHVGRMSIGNSAARRWRTGPRFVARLALVTGDNRPTWRVLDRSDSAGREGAGEIAEVRRSIDQMVGNRFRTSDL